MAPDSPRRCAQGPVMEWMRPRRRLSLRIRIHEQANSRTEARRDRRDAAHRTDPNGLLRSVSLGGQPAVSLRSGPKRPDGSFEVGRLGKDATIEDGYRAACLTGLQLLAVAKPAAGELSRIEAVVKLLGMVNAEPDFADHPKGYQRLLGPIRGDAWGGWTSRKVGRRHGLAAQWHLGRDRSNSFGPTLSAAFGEPRYGRIIAAATSR